MPSWPVVDTFVRATSPLRETDNELEKATAQANGLWRRARYEQRQKTNPHRPEPPVLGLVRSEADLAAILVELYERAGAPSMTTMEHRAGGLGILPHSTAHRIITRKTLPYTFAQFNAFLTACELPPQRRTPWHEMWTRVFGTNDQDHAHKPTQEPARLRTPHALNTRTRPTINTHHNTNTPNSA